MPTILKQILFSGQSCDNYRCKNLLHDLDIKRGKRFCCFCRKKNGSGGIIYFLCKTCRVTLLNTRDNDERTVYCKSCAIKIRSSRKHL